MSEIPPPVARVMESLVELQRQILWLEVTLGQYVGLPAPGAKHHEALRKSGRDVKASANEVITAVEALRTIGRKAEKEASRG